MLLPIIGVIFAVFASIALPVAALILLKLKFKTGILAAITGAAGFFIFVLVLERLLHSIVLPNISGNAWAYTAYACLASGIFEETSRLLGFTLLKKAKKLSLADALSYGLGHAGIEAILITGVSILSLAASALVPGGELLLQAMPAPLLFIAGLERILAIALHVALSLLIWLCVIKKQGRWLYLCSIALHMLANLGAAMAQAGLIENIALIYCWLLAAIIIAFVIYGYKYKVLCCAGAAKKL